jgi:hypothetical protein
MVLRRAKLVMRSIAVWFAVFLHGSSWECMPQTGRTTLKYLLSSQAGANTLFITDLVPGGGNPAEIERLNRIMGPQNFRHIHHYCRGLFLTASGVYFTRTKLHRDRALAASLGEYDYVIDRVEPSFTLLPEILTKKGESLVLLGQPEAVQALGRAINLRPDYWPAYAALSDYYRNIGNLKEARQWLQQGLVAAPKRSHLPTDWRS